MKNEIHPNLYEVDVVNGAGKKIKLWYPLNQAISISSSPETHGAWTSSLNNRIIGGNSRKLRTSVYDI
jgi:hypothetical protein